MTICKNTKISTCRRYDIEGKYLIVCLNAKLRIERGGEYVDLRENELHEVDSLTPHSIDGTVDCDGSNSYAVYLFNQSLIYNLNEHKAKTLNDMGFCLPKAVLFPPTLKNN